MCEAGLFVPIGNGEMYITFGLDGLLSRITLEMGLYVNILKNNYIINIHAHVYEQHFFFYLKVGIYIKLKMISLRFDYYIFYIVIPHFTADLSFYRVYSFRNKLLESSCFAKLNLFGILNIPFTPKYIEKNIFSIIKEKE